MCCARDVYSLVSYITLVTFAGSFIRSFTNCQTPIGGDGRQPRSIGLSTCWTNPDISGKTKCQKAATNQLRIRVLGDLKMQEPFHERIDAWSGL